MPKTATLLTIWFLLAFQWMIFLHELGHILAAKLLTVELTFVDLYPLRLTYSLYQPSPYSSLIVWSGLLFGSLVTFLTFFFWKFKSLLIGPFLQGCSLFCVAANGMYLCFGILESYSDSGMLVQLGWPTTIVFLLGAVLAATGYLFLSKWFNEFWAKYPARKISWKVSFVWASVLGIWIAIQYGVATMVDRVLVSS